MSDQNRADANGSTRIRFGGVGGQGIVLAGRLLGKAAALFDGKEAVCTQTYGPEARGGASRSDVIISDQPVDYPFVTEADILAALFHEAYARFRDRLRPGGLLIVDTGLVQPFGDDENICGLPATRIADELGSRLVSNLVILGYLVGRTGVVSRASVVEAIRTTVRAEFVELDMKALDAGIDLARGELAS
jgi:2-oxoglutarate ferredoxin oxidoreductase subunit gamma